MSDKPLQPVEALGEIAEAVDRIGLYMRVLREEERLEGGGLGVTYSVGDDVENIRAALTAARASLEAVEEPGYGSSECRLCGGVGRYSGPDPTSGEQTQIQCEDCFVPAPPPDPKPDYKGALWDLRGAVHAYLLACVLSGDPAVIGELRVDLTEADRTALRFLGGKGERDG